MLPVGRNRPEFECHSLGKQHLLLFQNQARALELSYRPQSANQLGRQGGGGPQIRLVKDVRRQEVKER